MWAFKSPVTCSQPNRATPQWLIHARPSTKAKYPFTIQHRLTPISCRKPANTPPPHSHPLAKWTNTIFISNLFTACSPTLPQMTLVAWSLMKIPNYPGLVASYWHCFSEWHLPGVLVHSTCTGNELKIKPHNLVWILCTILHIHYPSWI